MNNVLFALINSPGWFYGGWMIALLILAFLLAIAILLFATVLFHRHRKINDSNIRIYTYDYGKKTFFFFDRNNLLRRKELSEKEFVSQFQTSDSYQVRNWLDDIISGKNRRDFIQADVKIHIKGKAIPSILELTGINREKCLIHFESHLLPFTAFGQNASKRRRAKYMFTSPEEAESFLAASDPNSMASCYFISLYVDEKNKGTDSYRELMELSRLTLDMLGGYLGKERRLLAFSDNDFFLMSTLNMSKAMCMQFADTLETKIRQEINRSRPDTKVRFAIGLSTGTFFQKDYKKAKEQCQLMCEAIKKGDFPNDILFYDQDFFQKERKRKTDKEEIQMFIRNETFRLFFLPSLDIRSFQRSLYLLEVLSYGTSIRDFSEILRIAESIRGGSEAIVSSIAKRLDAILAERKDRISLLLPVIYSSLDGLVKALGHNDARHYDLVLCLRESDLLPSLPNLKQMIDKLGELKKRGFSLAIRIANATSLLPNRLLRLFSYVVVGKEFTGRMGDASALATFQLIESDYKPLSIPILYCDLQNNSQIELCAHYGGSLFQASSLGQPSSRPEEIDEDELDELKKNLA
ncbi:MAG TPA: hypothetical protein IAC60_03780 [Candidatus Enterosoma merdigallinarum]|nr:hypothetical protein [Candidatus Enterosoma merdigallinarum]